MTNSRTPRTWLDVPWEEKDNAKSAGARWDPTARRWYAPPGKELVLRDWTHIPIPVVLAGEDRQFGHGLFVDLIPQSCWLTNVRSCISKRDWLRLRLMVTSRAGHHCEACGAADNPADRQFFDVHERWLYNDNTSTQKLIRLICLCRPCHETTHYGFARISGRAEIAFHHLMAVTGMTEDQANQHIDTAFSLFDARSAHHWDLDLTVLTDAGIAVAAPPSAAQRATFADLTNDN
jgi:hypothetical protein